MPACQVSEDNTPGRGGAVAWEGGDDSSRLNNLGPHPTPMLGQLSLQTPSGFENLCETAAGESCQRNAFVYFGSLSCVSEFAQLSFPVKLSLTQNTAITQVMWLNHY